MRLTRVNIAVLLTLVGCAQTPETTGITDLDPVPTPGDAGNGGPTSDAQVPAPGDAGPVGPTDPVTPPSTGTCVAQEASRFLLEDFEVLAGAGLQVRSAGDARVLFNAGPDVLTAGIARFEAEESRGSFTIEEGVQSRCSVTMGNWGCEGGSLVGRGSVAAPCGGEVSITFARIMPGHLRFEVSASSDSVNYLELRQDSQADEHFYGFGEQYTHMDLKGHEVPVLSQEQGIGRGHPVISRLLDTASAGSGGDAYTTYIGVPQYLTSERRSMMLENTEYVVFDLREDDRATVRLSAGHMTGRILLGDSMMELLERYTEYSGRMPPLPDWLNAGAVVGMQGGTQAVRDVWQQLQARDTPIAGFWLQDWVGKRSTIAGSQLWWNWELDNDRYPGWDQLVSDLAADGVRTMGYINPFLVDATEKGNVQRSLYQEALERDYLVKQPNGEPYAIGNTDFDAGLVDLTNPEAWEWLKAVIKDQMIDVGLSGWMADFGEALPFDAVLASGESAETYHNRYPEAWAQLNKEAVAEAGREGDITFFMRAGYTRSPAYSTLFWEGDQTVTWDSFDGFQSAIKGLLSGGMSGFTLNHSDIGGYLSLEFIGIGYSRERDLLMRWIEANAFTAVYRTHEGNQPEANAQLYSDAGTYDQFARFAKVYAALAPYRERLFEEAFDKGYPVVRHPLLHYPDDEALHSLADDELIYLLGADILVAPMLVKNTTRRTVHLPADQWVHLWTGQRYGNLSTSSEVEVDCPVGQPAVFYREGSEAGTSLRDSLMQMGLM